MLDLDHIPHHPAMQDIVNVLCNRIQVTDTGFFKAEVAFFLGKLASNMRASVVTKDRGEIPINIYTIALAVSGFGKGHSVNIIEEKFMGLFKKRFLEETLPVISEAKVRDIAAERAVRDGINFDEMLDKVLKEYRQSGEFAYTFDSGTVPALKQLRHKLLLADCGAINYQVDEIGSNLIESTEMLEAYLELYDQGLIKQKITKNTAENQRFEEIDGKTPANMLLFGTPSRLLDGGRVEEHFYSFLDTGFARRCFFGWAEKDDKAYHTMTAEEIYYSLISQKDKDIIERWSRKFYALADPSFHNWKIMVGDDIGIKLVEYRIVCEKRAAELPEHEEIKKAELNHRYFKALKLAGAYAFIDGVSEMSMDHLLMAIKLTEESGKSFERILNREKAYMRLARYIAAANTELTHADLIEDLPFYRGGQRARADMLTMAKAWGYKEHIIIKNRYVDNIELLWGETLEETDLNKIIISCSDHYAYNYVNGHAPFEMLDKILLRENFHWTNHHLIRGHRTEENVIVGFNAVVLDIDEGISLKSVHELLKEYKFITYTTKRHTPEHNRFRLILPINYKLELNTEDYKEFMQSLTTWLPFKVDEGANQRSRKWASHAGGEFFINKEGILLDATNFIPDTSKNENFRKQIQKIESLDNLERWFASKITVGNRNNQILRYAMFLADSGMDIGEVSNHVLSFNSKLDNPLDEQELRSTVLVSVGKKFEKMNKENSE